MAGDRARGRAGGTLRVRSTRGRSPSAGRGRYAVRDFRRVRSTSVTFLFFQRVCDTIIETWPLAI